MGKLQETSLALSPIDQKRLALVSNDHRQATAPVSLLCGTFHYLPAKLSLALTWETSEDPPGLLGAHHTLLKVVQSLACPLSQSSLNH